jgi:lysophospholipid acyltransferase (LPLAT)-like uncharacterized protein
MDQKKKQQEQVNSLVTALGGIAEMSHVFYTSMIDAGATSREATAAMNGFIAAFWHEQMEDARRKNGGQDNGQE